MPNNDSKYNTFPTTIIPSQTLGPLLNINICTCKMHKWIVITCVAAQLPFNSQCQQYGCFTKKHNSFNVLPTGNWNIDGCAQCAFYHSISTLEKQVLKEINLGIGCYKLFSWFFIYICINELLIFITLNIIQESFL